MPYCKKDYGPLCPKCPGCTQSVFPKEVFSAFGKAYHKRCFKCQVGLLTSPLGPEQALNFSFFFFFFLLFFFFFFFFLSFFFFIVHPRLARHPLTDRPLR